MKKPLLFNIEKLERLTSGDPNAMVQCLFYWYKNISVPARATTKIKPLGNLLGSSFLLNPEALFQSKVDINWKAQYIQLAGRRDLFLYRQYSIKTLDLSLFPDINVTAIKQNPLLEIASNKITFKLED